VQKLGWCFDRHFCDAHAEQLAVFVLVGESGRLFLLQDFVFKIAGLKLKVYNL
jgi:hypothetical protein